MKIEQLPTPALIVDLDLLQTNLAQMGQHAARRGKLLRPHAKAHKCVQIARRQMALGAVGICVATVAEAEVMIGAGIRGVLLTSPVADAGKVARLARLAISDPDLTVVVDHPTQVELYAQAASEAGVVLGVLVDIDVGDHRTGAAPGDPALRLADSIGSKASLRLRGLQAYSVRASHVHGFDERRRFSHDALAPAIRTFHRLQREGMILSVGSTGTFDIDVELQEVTEIQVGSYVFMDADYRRIGGVEFQHALRVLATVVSANHEDFVTVDAGFKAFSTDRAFGPEPVGLPGSRYDWAGDEFGYLRFLDASQRLGLGDKVKFVPPHCDPTVNLYDRLYVCRGDQVEDTWPIMNRLPLVESYAC